MRLAASACMIGGFAAQSLSRSATWSQPCLRVSDDGSDWSDSLPYFSCPAHTGRRPTALPRTVVWLPQPRPHRREAIGSIVLICRVRSNAGTLRMLGQPEQKQSARDRPTAALRTARFARDCSARDCFRWAVDPPAVDINTGCWVTRDRKVTGRTRARHPRRMSGGALTVDRDRGQRGCASGQKPSRELPHRTTLLHRINRTDKGSKLQRASSRRSAAGPRPPVRVVWPVPVSEVQPAEVSKAGCERQSARMVRRSGCRCERRDRVPPARRRTSETSRMGQLAGAYFSLVWAPRRRHFGSGGDEG